MSPAWRQNPVLEVAGGDHRPGDELPPGRDPDGRIGHLGYVPGDRQPDPRSDPKEQIGSPRPPSRDLRAFARGPVARSGAIPHSYPYRRANTCREVAYVPRRPLSANQPSCSRTVSAELTPYSPGGSTFSSVIAPSSTTMEKRWPRVPRPSPDRSHSNPRAAT